MFGIKINENDFVIEIKGYLYAPLSVHLSVHPYYIFMWLIINLAPRGSNCNNFFIFIISGIPRLE